MTKTLHAAPTASRKVAARFSADQSGAVAVSFALSASFGLVFLIGGLVVLNRRVTAACAAVSASLR
jgi:Flp pilus assembly pilin Flp